MTFGGIPRFQEETSYRSFRQVAACLPSGGRVERSSTIPLKGLHLPANISISRHGELISRASCPLRRPTPSSENSELNRATSKVGGAHNPLLSSRVLTSNLSEWGFTPDYEVPVTLDNSAEIPLLSPGPSSIMEPTSTWAENFQDISLYCQDPKLSSLTKDMVTGRERLIGQADDELNTPEIGNEFNFDSWSKPESIEDTLLWEDNPFEKISSDHYEEGSFFPDQHNSDLPDETNMGLMPLEYNSEETVHDRTRSFISHVDVSYESKSTNVDNDEKVNDSDCPSASERVGTAEFYTINAEVSNKSSLEEMVAEGEPLKQNQRTAPKFTLPLATFENPVVLNTPDVLERLDTQPGFDILKYVLEDNTSENSQSQPAVHSLQVSCVDVHIKEENTPENPAPDTSVLDDSENYVRSLSENDSTSKKDSSSEPTFVVIPSAQYSPVRIIIKKEPEASCSSHKRKQRVKSVVVDESASSDDCDDEDDYRPPVKIRKRTASCTKTTNECSRYRELRDRNNEASRKSRQNRKAKEEEMKVQAAQLEADNQRLKIRAEELEKLVDTLRKALLTAMVKGK